MCQEQLGQALGVKALPHRFVVTTLMDPKPIALAGRLHEMVESRQVCLGGPTHADALSAGQPNVVPPLGFHPHQDFILIRPQVENDGCARLNCLAAAPKPQGFQVAGQCRVIGPVGLNLEEDGTSVAGGGAQRVQEGRQCLVNRSKHGTARNVDGRAAGRGPDKSLGTANDPPPSLARDAQRLPAKVAFEVAPGAGLKQMSPGRAGDECVPLGVVSVG